jgi:septal ring factor EnvC (AmiA/AmiB activator)
VSERRVSAVEASLADVNTELAAKQKDYSAREDDYAATVMNLLRMQSLPPTALFTAPENVRQMMRTASVLEQANAALAVEAAKLRADTQQLKQLQAIARDRSEQTRREEVSLKAEQEHMADAIGERQKLARKLNADHARTEAKMADLSRESQSLQELISKLEENARAQASRRNRPEPVEHVREFEGHKNSLKSPVAGSVIHHFGERKNDNETYRGLVFRTRAGATVVAPYDGEVVFTGPFRDYGRMVLIKHKGGYISLIAGLGEISTSLDQTVIRGEPIGTMPDAGSPDAYVELRDKDAKPIDPTDWFAKVP